MKIYFLLLALFISFVSFSQSTSGNSACIPKPDMLDGQKVFRLANKLAEFQGGDRKMMEYIQDHLQKKEKKRNLNLSMVITFVVDSTGQVRNPCIQKISASNSMGLAALEQEIIAVFASMPKWNAAVLQDKKAYTRIILPVQLVLQ